MNFTSHTPRFVTGLVLLTFVVLAVVLGGLLKFFIALVLSTLSLIEFYALFQEYPLCRTTTWFALVANACVLTAAGLGQPIWTLGILFAVFWLVNFHFLFAFATNPGHIDGASFRDVGLVLTGLFYITGGLHVFLYFTNYETILVLAACIATDVGAYYGGSCFGKGHIWQVVSPGKTWAGAVSGLVCCLSATFTVGYVWGRTNPYDFLILGLFLYLAAIYGDFFESALKRALNVKDTGALLPGHGGVLDRIDSTLLAGLFYAAVRTQHIYF
ncbi:phosphatidate cytidylyltransferase [Desulfovibrionales bacterium]